MLKQKIIELYGEFMIENLIEKKLIWLPELGIGYYPVKDSPYDKEYFEKYVKMEKTEIGMKLNSARVNIVENFCSGQHVVDIGIGSGAFVKSCQSYYGYDINEHAVDYLKKINKFFDVRHEIENVCFWDSLEHIHNPKEILDNVQSFCFISCPIYKNCEHILSSKHFRKDEHCWYWTEKGLENFMSFYGFSKVFSTDIETKIGREDIMTFVFERIK